MLHFKLSSNSHCSLPISVSNDTQWDLSNARIPRASKVVRSGMVVNMEHYGIDLLYLRMV